MSENKPLSIRGRKFTGLVISDKMSKTVTVEWERRRYLPKYERYQKRRTKVKAHNPEAMNAEKGDIVIIEETRPISKTKNFIVTSIVKKHTEVQHTTKESKAEKPRKSRDFLGAENVGAFSSKEKESKEIKKKKATKTE